MAWRNSQHDADIALPRTLPLSSFPKVSGRTACLRTRMPPAPLFGKRAAVRDVIFHFYLLRLDKTFPGNLKGNTSSSSGEEDQVSLSRTSVRKDCQIRAWPVHDKEGVMTTSAIFLGTTCCRDSFPLQLSLFGSWKKFQELQGAYSSHSRHQCHTPKKVPSGFERNSCRRKYILSCESRVFCWGLWLQEYAQTKWKCSRWLCYRARTSSHCGNLRVKKKVYIKISNNKQMKVHVLKGKCLLAAQKKNCFFIFL